MSGRLLRSPVFLRLGLMTGLAVLFALPAAHAESPLDTYRGLLASGDIAGAVQAGETHYLALKANSAGARAFESADGRLGAIADARALVEYKLKMIAASLSSESKSPFLYVIPTPQELYRQVLNSFTKSRPVTSGLSAEDASFVSSYLETRQALADLAVVEVYLSLAASGQTQQSAMGRAYLSAYVAGAHDDATWPSVLQLLGRRVSKGELPVFMADDFLTTLEDAEGAWSIIGALDAVSWARWPDGEKVRVMKDLAALAQKSGNVELAASANKQVVEGASSAEGEQAQMRIITDLAEKKKDFAGAAAACEEYLKRFATSKNAPTVEYLKALYEYQADKFDEALASIFAFKNRHSDSKSLPEVMLLEGLAYLGKARNNDAIKVLTEIIDKYPKSRVAGKAQFMIGYAHLSGQKYVEAKDAFRRVVDFYPDDSNAPRAKEYLERLKGLTAPK